MDFKNKVILITGASSGIGAGAAEYFATLGATLSLTGRNGDRLNELAEKIVQTNTTIPKPLTISADVTDESDVQRIIDSTIQHFGRLDVLINNAGIIIPGGIETISLDDYDRTMLTNVRSIFHLTKLAIPHLITTKGNIVNVSSVNGMRSFPGVIAYNISKSAVDQFTRCIALELAPKGVRVNSVNPGVIITDVHRRAGMNEEQYQKFLEHSKTTHALGRVGNVSEVAAAIAYLASDSAGFVTGLQLAIDGGRHIMCPR